MEDVVRRNGGTRRDAGRGEREEKLFKNEKPPPSEHPPPYKNVKKRDT